MGPPGFFSPAPLSSPPHDHRHRPSYGRAQQRRRPGPVVVTKTRAAAGARSAGLRSSGAPCGRRRRAHGVGRAVVKRAGGPAIALPVVRQVRASPAFLPKSLPISRMTDLAHDRPRLEASVPGTCRPSRAPAFATAMAHRRCEAVAASEVVDRRIRYFPARSATALAIQRRSSPRTRLAAARHPSRRSTGTPPERSWCRHALGLRRWSSRPPPRCVRRRWSADRRYRDWRSGSYGAWPSPRRGS